MLSSVSAPVGFWVELHMHAIFLFISYYFLYSFGVLSKAPTILSPLKVPEEQESSLQSYTKFSSDDAFAS